MGRPRKTEARDTRRDILDRSLELFAFRGFTGASMREIARAVGVRESALYHHFSNKNAILSAILSESGPGAITALLSDELVSHVAVMGGHQFLRMLGDTVLTLWVTPRERHLIRLVMSEWPRLKEAGLLDLPVQVAAVRRKVESLFKRFVDAGVIREIDPKATALRFLGPLIVIRIQHLADLTKKPDVEALRRDLVLHLDSFWETVKPLPATRTKRSRA